MDISPPPCIRIDGLFLHPKQSTVLPGKQTHQINFHLVRKNPSEIHDSMLGSYFLFHVRIL